MSDYVQEIAEKEERLAQLQQQREQLSNSDQVDYSALSNVVDGINALTNRLSELYEIRTQERANQLRIQGATEKAAYIMDNLTVEDLTMRELSAGENEYQALRIAVQNVFIQLEEENITRISNIQAEENAEKQALKQQIEALKNKFDEENKQAFEDQETITSLRAQLAQSKAETADFQGKLKNATDEIERLNSQVNDLRIEIAVGARNAYKVTDVEQTQQLKQLADQIKASRIHVYDVTPDSEINPRSYTAKRADNGESVTYNWTQAKNYIEIKDAAEVERFRQQFADQKNWFR